DLDNTYIFDGASPCDVNLTAIQCSAKRGGLLDKGASTTWEQFSNLSAAGAAPDIEPTASGNSFGTDSITINSTFALEEFPIGVIRNGPQIVNGLGLGRNSTFINRLFSVGAIASKTWGLAVGWQGALSKHQTDGSLVLGGYDAALTNGSNFTYPFTVGTDCSLTVTISDIALNFKNGSSTTLLPPSHGSAIQACLSPFAPWISISEDIFKTFLNVTGFPENLEPGRSRGINHWGMLFTSEDVYDGDMTIKLLPGIEIRIPNHQLVVPDYSLDKQGLLRETNPSNRELLINSLQEINKNDLPLLGRPFFSSAYVLVDQEHKEFTVWQGNPTATEKKLVPIGPTCTPSIVPTGLAPDSTSSAAAAPQTPETSDGQNIGTGPIAGIVIGCLAGLTIVALLLHRYFRHHQRRPSQPQPPAIQEKNNDNRVSSYIAFKPEMPTDRQPPQEMPIEQNQPYVVGPYEMGAPPGTVKLEQGRWDGAQRGDQTQERAELL
ncbi:MAG: hypothetical protein Q9198_005363, partial [Flavoplaca austrocitrina]